MTFHTELLIVRDLNTLHFLVFHRTEIIFLVSFSKFTFSLLRVKLLFSPRTWVAESCQQLLSKRFLLLLSDSKTRSKFSLLTDLIYKVSFLTFKLLLFAWSWELFSPILGNNSVQCQRENRFKMSQVLFRISSENWAYFWDNKENLDNLICFLCILEVELDWCVLPVQTAEALSCDCNISAKGHSWATAEGIVCFS